jgi:hypothetical protein
MGQLYQPQIIDEYGAFGGMVIGVVAVMIKPMGL